MLVCIVRWRYHGKMNTEPLPIHLLMELPGFSLLGQTAFGAYFKIIFNWWINDCPPVLVQHTDFRSLAGMKEIDWRRHGPVIQPVLVLSIAVLQKHHGKILQKRDRQRILMAKVNESNRISRAAALNVSEVGKRLKDKNISVNPTFIKPTPQPFHEGFNLHGNKPSNSSKKRPSTTATLRDK